MKNQIFNIIITLVFILTTSCSSNTYKFIQIFEVEPSHKNESLHNNGTNIIYKNNDCVITYNLWKEGGNAGFIFANKTDDILYIDLSKTFFIKNGIVHNYFLNREWKIGESKHSEYSTTSSSILSNSGNQQFASYTNTNSSALSIKEEKTVMIPPHYSVIISEYSITNSEYLDCEMERYPSKKSTMQFSEENSPVKFVNYITYSKGNNSTEKHIENEFYVSSITNYAEPEVVVFTEQDMSSCRSIKNPDKRNNYSSKKVYQKYIKPQISTSSSFYINYEVACSTQVYKSPYNMQWNEYLGGFTGYFNYWATNSYTSQDQTKQDNLTVNDSITNQEQEGSSLSQEQKIIANKHYIAWLMKVGRLSYDRNLQKELWTLYDRKEIESIRNHYTSGELYEKSKEHNKEIERFAR